MKHGEDGKRDNTIWVGRTPANRLRCGDLDSDWQLRTEIAEDEGLSLLRAAVENIVGLDVFRRGAGDEIDGVC